MSQDGKVPRSIKFAIISDLHYRDSHPGKECRPSAAQGNDSDDPIEAFSKLVGANSLTADYLLCPGDITDKASKKALTEGWKKLQDLEKALGARHLIATTGNHEVDSRAGESHDKSGNSELEIDPIGHLQGLDGYPSSIWNGEDRKWVYWGRGYEFIRDEEVLFLLINSSHFHPTTRENEFERGRIGDLSIKMLHEEIAEQISKSDARVFVALLHHPPISHESLDFDLGRIEMFNGSRLIEILDRSGRPWLVVHGHKHHGRIVIAQGSGFQPIVFAAGSAGAHLVGKHALNARLQCYVVDVEIPNSTLTPSLKGSVRAFSWIDHAWVSALVPTHGIPDGCGFAIPSVDLTALAQQIRKRVLEASGTFSKWNELVAHIPQLLNLLPGQLPMLKSSVEAIGGSFTWPADRAFPDDVYFPAEEPK